jgi:Holliday junction resolvase
MKSPEGYEKDDICKHLDSIGAWYFKPYMAGFGKSGVADIIACIAGTFWSVEVKREGKVPTKLQAARIDEVRQAGGKATWGTAKMVIADIEKWRRMRPMPVTLGQ